MTEAANIKSGANTNGRNPDRYAVVLLDLITDGRISHAEFRLLCFLMAHDLPDRRVGGRRKGYATVSHSTIAKALHVEDVKNISRSLRRLEKKGFIRRDLVPGKLGKIYLISTPGTERSPSTVPPVLSAPGTERHQTPGTEYPPKNRIEEEKLRVPSASCPSDTQQPVIKPGRARKPPLQKKQTDPTISRLITYFANEYQRIFNHKYTVAGAKDGQSLKTLLRDHSEETLQQCTILFLEDPDPWLTAKRTISILRSRINQYVQQLTHDPADTSWDKEF